MDKFRKRLGLPQAPRKPPSQTTPPSFRTDFQGKIFLCGVPRSGTTIITKFLGSLPGAKSLSEPLRKRVEKVEKENHPILIIKDVYRSQFMPYPYASHKSCIQYFNDPTYTTIFIVRNPLDLWQSQKRMMRIWSGGWDKLTTEEFAQNCREFYKHVKGIIIDYDRFVAGPVEEFRTKTGWKIEGEPKLGPMEFRWGDQRALHSDKILPARKYNHSEEEKAILADVHEQWTEIISKLY